VAQPDELIDFHHLKARKGMTQLEIEDEVATDLQRATGIATAAGADATRLQRVLQLTGEGAPAETRG
jgi:coatomer subunit beta